MQPNPSIFADDLLSESIRGQIHDFALFGRERLTREAREQLEGVYGLYPDGRLEKPAALPALADPEIRATYDRLKTFLDDEVEAGLARPEAVSKLVKEIAFTHLNRLVAFKMMEARKLIREAVGRGAESNGYKFYLADHPDENALHTLGDAAAAYQHFLLWQAGEIAREIRVLFDPTDLASAIFPRELALKDMLAALNAPDLAPAWQADDAIGWVYQYFNEPELQAAFAAVRESGKKFEATDIPAATQLFTLRWIVRYLVENTLGRLWLDIHPDSGLKERLSYLVPLPDGAARKRPQLKPVSEITLLDPACGTMHFGMVAFDLFAAMYQEELERAGQPGWPSEPSVNTVAEIPGAILRRNIFGIDIDLRAVQLAALSLYVKAKRANKAAEVTDHNLACADVQAAEGPKLDAFIETMKFSPIYARLMRALWERLGDIDQLGSLLQLDETIRTLVGEERAAFRRESRQPDLFGHVASKFETEAGDEAYWSLLGPRLVESLGLFARQQAELGRDVSFFTREAGKGLRVLELMLRRYDVVVTNPPYLSRRKMNKELTALLDDQYPEGKGDLYAAFIQRAIEFVASDGRVGILTMHSFMFISSYETLRNFVTQRAVIETLAHAGPGLFSTGNPGTLQTVALVIRREKAVTNRDVCRGVYFRLVDFTDADAKRVALETALRSIGKHGDHALVCISSQSTFRDIPGGPWVYWISKPVRDLFAKHRSLADVAEPRAGMHGGDRFRFARLWWEVGCEKVGMGFEGREAAFASGKKWFPYMKGGPLLRWYGNLDWVVAFDRHHFDILSELGNKLPSRQYYFRRGITYSAVTTLGFGARISPGGFLFDAGGSSLFPSEEDIPYVLACLNSPIARGSLRLLNPTINIQAGDVARIPMPIQSSRNLDRMVGKAIHLSKLRSTLDESTYDFLVPPLWTTGLTAVQAAHSALENTEDEISAGVFRLYGIDETEQAAIRTEMDGSAVQQVGDEFEPEMQSDAEPEVATDGLTQDKLARLWLSYAVGIVLGRFEPGRNGGLGSAVYSRKHFVVGALPAPDSGWLDEFIGAPDCFPKVEIDGDRHVFNGDVEKALGELARPDGIAVFEEHHSCDLVGLVSRALSIMLGDSPAHEIIQLAAGNDLRGFLEKDFFAKWHIPQYRKRPVYWPIQSARRNYGFVLFQEKINQDTFFALQRDPYLDTKRRSVELQLADLQAKLKSAAGKQRKALEKQVETARALAQELEDFAKALEAITAGGYVPEPNWIDDGVILRMAPLWSVIPAWKSEPKKYWDRLEKGDFDWSHIAMHYWPDRVREKCKTNKSYAIAHGLAS